MLLESRNRIPAFLHWIMRPRCLPTAGQESVFTTSDPLRKHRSSRIWAEPANITHLQWCLRGHRSRKHHAFAVVPTWPQMSSRSKSNQSRETSRMCSVLGGTRKHPNFCDSRNCHEAPAGGGVCHLRDPERVTPAGTVHRWQMPTALLAPTDQSALTTRRRSHVCLEISYLISSRAIIIDTSPSAWKYGVITCTNVVSDPANCTTRDHDDAGMGRPICM